LFWQLVATFTDVEVSMALVSATTVFVSALVGYLTKETVLPVQREE
jgi:hypothetical protein